MHNQVLFPYAICNFRNTYCRWKITAIRKREWVKQREKKNKWKFYDFSLFAGLFYINFVIFFHSKWVLLFYFMYLLFEGKKYNIFFYFGLNRCTSYAHHNAKCMYTSSYVAGGPGLYQMFRISFQIYECDSRKETNEMRIHQFRCVHCNIHTIRLPSILDLTVMWWIK